MCAPAITRSIDFEERRSFADSPSPEADKTWKRSEKLQVFNMFMSLTVGMVSRSDALCVIVNVSGSGLGWALLKYKSEEQARKTAFMAHASKLRGVNFVVFSIDYRLFCVICVLSESLHAGNALDQVFVKHFASIGSEDTTSGESLKKMFEFGRKNTDFGERAKNHLRYYLTGAVRDTILLNEDGTGPGLCGLCFASVRGPCCLPSFRLFTALCQRTRWVPTAHTRAL